jgi:hypothetical protein
MESFHAADLLLLQTAACHGGNAVDSQSICESASDPKLIAIINGG